MTVHVQAVSKLAKSTYCVLLYMYSMIVITSLISAIICASNTAQNTQAMRALLRTLLTNCKYDYMHVKKSDLIGC